jgi:hypothetical protein
MKVMNSFTELKHELLRRAVAQGACSPGINAATRAKTIKAMGVVVRHNFYWCCVRGVITPDLIEQYREEFAAQRIYLNEDVMNGGCLLTDGNCVSVRGRCKVYYYE